MPTTVPNRPISGAEGGEEAFEAVRDAAPGFLDRFLHHFARSVDIAQRGGEHGAERRILLEGVDDVGRSLLVAVDLDDFAKQLLRQDLFTAQVNQAFDDQGQGDDGGDQQWPDGPACGLKNGEQVNS
jgi:hypothetical protein